MKYIEASKLEALQQYLMNHRDDDMGIGLWPVKAGGEFIKLVDINALIKAAPEVSSEPVAWILHNNEGFDPIFRDHKTKLICKDADWSDWKPLYTAPPPDRADT